VSSVRVPGPTWQPSDASREALASADAHAEAAGYLATNGDASVAASSYLRGKIRPAKRVDIGADEWDVGDSAYGACLAVNLLHIAPHAYLGSLFRGVGRALKPGGLFGIYDTWTFDGAYVGPSNEGFDAGLRARGYSGIPAIEACDAAAQAAGLTRREEILYLPANNQFVVYEKR